MKLDESYNQPQMRLDRSYNLTIPRTNLSTGSAIRPLCKLAKFWGETSSKMHKPKTYNEAIDNSIYGNWCHETIDEELWNFGSHQAWCYKKLLLERKAIRCKWVFKIKYKPNRKIERYKARLIAQRFSQVLKVDFTKIFAPTIRQESLRIFFALATLLGLILIQIDIIGAYLESTLG